MKKAQRIVALASIGLFGFSSSVLGQPFEAGQKVVVVKAGELETLNRQQSEVFVGLPLVVRKVEGNRLLVSNGNPGWLDASHVMSPDSALQHFDKLLVENPHDDTILSARANTLATLDRLQEAIDEFSKLVSEFPKEISYRNERAGCYLKMGELQKAIADFDAVLLQTPLPAVFMNRGSCKLQLRDWEGARKDLTEACRREQNLAPSWLMLGNLESDQGNFEAAVAGFDSYLAIMPNDAAAWFAKGNAHVQVQQGEKALQAFERAIKLDPKDPNIQRNRGLTLRDLGKTEQAIEAFSEMMKQFPTDITGFVNRAMIHLDAGNHEQAIEDFTAAIRVQSDSAFCYFQRGRAKMELDKVNDAIADYTRALELAPKPQGFVTRGEVYLKQKKFDLALADFDRALELNPKHEKASLLRGELLKARAMIDSKQGSASPSATEKAQEIPDGFELQKLELGGQILKPVGWKFKQGGTEGTLVYRIWESRPNDEENFDTMVTINVVSNVKEVGETPTEYAEKYVKKLVESGNVAEQFDPRKLGKDTQYSLIVNEKQTVDGREVVYRCRYFLIADDENGLLTVIICATLPSQWEKYEPMFRVITKSFVVLDLRDDSKE